MAMHGKKIPKAVKREPIKSKAPARAQTTEELVKKLQEEADKRAKVYGRK